MARCWIFRAVVERCGGLNAIPRKTPGGSLGAAWFPVQNACMPCMRTLCLRGEPASRQSQLSLGSSQGFLNPVRDGIDPYLEVVDAAMLGAAVFLLVYE